MIWKLTLWRILYLICKYCLIKINVKGKYIELGNIFVQTTKKKRKQQQTPENINVLSGNYSYKFWHFSCNKVHIFNCLAKVTYLALLHRITPWSVMLRTRKTCNPSRVFQYWNIYLPGLWALEFVLFCFNNHMFRYWFTGLIFLSRF